MLRRHSHRCSLRARPGAGGHHRHQAAHQGGGDNRLERVTHKAVSIGGALRASGLRPTAGAVDLLSS